MNIFYIDTDPVVAAQNMVDRHVVKMILESAQLLSTAHRVVDGVEYEGQSKTGRKAKRWKLYDAREEHLYSATHVNHPSAVWCRESVRNYIWLYEHFVALGEEYTYRYGKIHATIEKLAYHLEAIPENIKEWPMTPMPSCMDQEYIISDDPVVNYRNYYIKGKKSMHSWKNRPVPDWFNLNSVD